MQLQVYPCNYLSALRSLPNIEASALQLLLEQSSLLDYSGFPLKGKEIFFINAQRTRWS